MTPLRQKCIEDMQLCGLANKTQTAYLNNEVYIKRLRQNTTNDAFSYRCHSTTL